MDPWKGVFVEEEQQYVIAKGLVVPLPDFSRDIVIRVERIDG